MKTNRKQRGDAVKFLLFISLTDNCRFFPKGGKGYRQIIGQTIVENISSTKSYLVEKRQNIFDHCHRSSFVIDGEVVGDGRHNEQDHDAAAAVLRGDRPGSVEDL